MVDIGAKAIVNAAPWRRLACACPRDASAVAAGDTPKGEVLTVARLAGISAAKLTGQLIHSRIRSSSRR